jgi:malonyl-CoA decarboxylase
MKSASFFTRIIGEFVHPSEAMKAGRQVRRVIELCHALLSERGEVSGAALAREVLAEYRLLSEAARAPFLQLLASDFSPRPEVVAAAADAYRADPSAERLIRLQRAVEPPRQELFRRLNMAPGGTAAIISMREQVLSGLKANSSWIGLDADLAHLLASWFNRGFLTLRRIDWHTPAIVLEKLIAYEAVHQVRGWGDLRRRLEADRRCFAFFHPALPDEPLIFIEVALTRGVSDTVQPLLDPDAPVDDPARADTAIFYSITNCQQGLRGVSFGNLLIKQVVEELRRRLPRVHQFATLSPVPGFGAWLTNVQGELKRVARGSAMLETLSRLKAADWHRDAQAAPALKPLLMQLCACYLLQSAGEGEPADPVARFHLGNGARMERLNWLADVSEQGMRRSAGLMVNYVYDPDDVEKNHEAYVKEHRIVASHDLRALARGCPLSRKPARA